MLSRKPGFKSLIVVFINLVFIIFVIKKANERPKNENKKVEFENHQDDFKGITRDFYRHECKIIKRIGGYPQHVAAANINLNVTFYVLALMTILHLIKK